MDPKQPFTSLQDIEPLPVDLALLQKRYSRICSELMNRSLSGNDFKVADPEVISKAFFEAAARIMADPTSLFEAQAQFWTDWMELWQRTAQRMMGESAAPVIAPPREDRRFKDEDWNNLVPFDFLKQSYLLASRAIERTMGGIDDLPPETRRKVDFYTRQMLDALSPTNFALTNPVVVRETGHQGGENLLKGLENLLADLERGKGKLRVTMTDEHAFEVGRNVATTPGQVVFQNDLMQLIQYTPSTETVAKTPLLIIPPWINKFYILDLRDKNSFIKYCVDQGHTTFVISWVNPDKDLAHKSFEDYMAEGPLAALDAIEAITGETQTNVIGYCLGGTLLACTLAWLTAKRKAKRIASATFFTALTDFSEAGDLLVFIDDEQLEKLDQHLQNKGYLAGSYMGEVFSMLRSNDLIWSFVVNNYLLGREPFPFDLLYWNSDSTGMPAMMHSFYLRNMYRENKLVEPGGITLKDVPIDLRKVKTPCYLLSTREDHIAPWKATYAATQLYAGSVKFVLAASGHIAGVVNPPAANKYCYWTNADLPPSPDAWLETAETHEGSWWTDWQAFVSGFSGGQVPARQPGSADYPALEPAPGRYVKVRRGD